MAYLAFHPIRFLLSLRGSQYVRSYFIFSWNDQGNGAEGEADGWDWVFQAEERRMAREEAERWLWAARAVWLRGVVR